MIANIIVGGIFVGIILLAFKKAYRDVKNNKCSGCGGCSSKNKCSKK